MLYRYYSLYIKTLPTITVKVDYKLEFFKTQFSFSCFNFVTLNYEFHRVLCLLSFLYSIFLLLLSFFFFWIFLSVRENVIFKYPWVLAQVYPLLQYKASCILTFLTCRVDCIIYHIVYMYYIDNVQLKILKWHLGFSIPM